MTPETVTCRGRRAFVGFVLTVAACACSGPGGSAGQGTTAAAERPRPNLLLILNDQHRRDAVGAYGNRLIRTPNLDALAQRSVLFEAAYVTQPLCTPSRASLLTGLYPHTHGAALNNEPLSQDRRILTQMLPPGVYRAAWFGKWHLGNEIFRQRGLFSEFNGPPWPFKDRFTERLRTVLTPERWKLTVDDRSQGELYDLGQDPQERTNLFYDEAHLERVRALLEEIRSWQRRTGEEAMRFDEAEWRRNGRRLQQARRGADRERSTAVPEGEPTCDLGFLLLSQWSSSRLLWERNR